MQPLSVIQQQAEEKNQIVNLLKSRQTALRNFLGSEENALRFMSSVMNAISANPELLKCSQESLMGAFMECAALGLFPSNYSGDCWIIPYKEKAQFQIGYRGLKTLAYRSGVAKMGTEVVYSNDVYEEERGTNPHITHKPKLDGDRGTAYRAYAWAETQPGVIVFKSMGEEEIMRIKALSKAKNSSSSPWNSNDPEKWMWQKTAFKQLAKMLPTSDKMDRALYLDNVSERGGYIKNEKEIVEVPFDEIADDDAKVEQIKQLIDSAEMPDQLTGSKGVTSVILAAYNAHQITKETAATLKKICAEKMEKISGNVPSTEAAAEQVFGAKAEFVHDAEIVEREEHQKESHGIDDQCSDGACLIHGINN